jgi:hypothetical protein
MANDNAGGEAAVIDPGSPPLPTDNPTDILQR